MSTPSFNDIYIYSLVNNGYLKIVNVNAVRIQSIKMRPADIDFSFVFTQLPAPLKKKAKMATTPPNHSKFNLSFKAFNPLLILLLGVMVLFQMVNNTTVLSTYIFSPSNHCALFSRHR